MNNLLIRPAEEQDASEIAKVQVETWQYAYKDQIPQQYLDDLSIEKRTLRWKEIIKHHQTHSSQTFVAEFNSHVIGFCSVGACRDKDMDEKAGEIMAIYVDQNVMDQGAGSALMKKSLAHLKEQGFTKAVLWVLKTNTKSRQWYEHRGWQCEGMVKEETIQGAPTVDIRYTIDL